MTDYQDALVLENLDLVNWVIRTRISIPNRPLLTYDDFYAIGCEAICRAALKYQPDMGAFCTFRLPVHLQCHRRSLPRNELPAGKKCRDQRR